MIIEYKDNTMIVTHPTGIVSRYTKADILAQKREAEQEFEAANNAVIELNTQILNIELSE